MNYDTFLMEKERIADLSVETQKEFYARVLEEEQKESSVRMEAYFQYAVLFYYEGAFRKTIEILEPFMISYQSYAYSKQMIACFNLMGVAAQCEGEYVLARYCFNLALRVVKEKKEVSLFSREYNNLSLTYIEERKYETALQYIEKAEQTLDHADKDMGAYVYLNKSDIYNHLGQLEKAVQAFETSVKEYDGLEVLPDDTLICGVGLFYKLGDKEKYTDYICKVLDKLGDMYASEFIDACKVVFGCALDSENYALVERVIRKMDDYMATNPQENRVGLQVEQLKYIYAKKIGDVEAELAALEKKDHYYGLVVSALENQRANSMDEYLEMNKHLQEAVQNETRANQAKTSFLANMSHDIRTPMNAIVGITNLMEHAVHSPEKMENYLSKMQLSSRHMMGLINDLLDMTRIESGKVSLNMEPVKLAEQVMQIDDIIRPQAEEKEQHFEIRTLHVCHENLVTDAVRFRQVILNVLSNSVKYTPEGGTVRFYIEELPSEQEEKTKYRFMIKDNGMGMDQDLIAHIFDPFMRGEDSVINQIQGTGLGMSIVKNIVDLMGGSIHIDSEIGKGSCVTVVLELDIDQKEDARIEPLKVLLLSRNVEFMGDLSLSAEKKPVSLQTTSDGKKACQILQEEELDAVLLGREFCSSEMLRELRQSAEDAVMFLSINDSGENTAFENPEEINGEISYPFFFTNLEKEVNRIRSSSMDKAAGKSILNGMRFLCAEDNELNAEILTASLKIAGASCKVYSDGAQLVEAFKTVKPGEYDGILMDIQMPVMNGYEATKQIRSHQNPLGRTIPIIAMTANAFLEDVNASLAAGMNEHISKPIDMGILEGAMRRVINTQETSGNYPK